MAIVKSLGLGKARGSAGEFTYSTIQGRTIARTKPAHVHNPNTVPQRAQRLKMSNAVIAWRDVGQRLEKLWTKRKKYNSAYNSFVSANIANNGTFEMAESGTKVTLNEGFILGRGQYTANNLTWAKSEDDYSITIGVSDTLFHNMKVGDVIGSAFMDLSGEMIAIEEYIVTQDDIEGGVKSFKPVLGVEVYNTRGYAPFWYSQSRNLSSDCVVVEY